MERKDNLKEAWQATQAPKMNAADDAKFEARLNHILPVRKKKQAYQIWYSLGAVAVVCIGVVLFWPRANTQLLDDMQLALKSNSNAQTLAAVYTSKSQMKASDKELIAVFIEVLEQSNNANVKVALIDALLQFPKNKTIRKALLEALRKEKEPLVQIKLIDAMLTLKEKRAKEPIKAIIAQEETFPIVKRNATMAINHLN